jgi:hypothetical protein
VNEDQENYYNHYPQGNTSNEEDEQEIEQQTVQMSNNPIRGIALMLYRGKFSFLSFNFRENNIIYEIAHSYIYLRHSKLI